MIQGHFCSGPRGKGGGGGGPRNSALRAVRAEPHLATGSRKVGRGPRGEFLGVLGEQFQVTGRARACGRQARLPSELMLAIAH